MSEAASPGHSLNDGQTRRRVAQEEGAHRSLLYPSRNHETDPSSPGQGHPVVVRVGAQASTLRAAIHRKMTRVLIKVRAQNNRSRAITLQHPSAQNGTYRAVLGHLNRLSEALDNAGYVRVLSCPKLSGPVSKACSIARISIRL